MEILGLFDLDLVFAPDGIERFEAVYDWRQGDWRKGKEGGTTRGSPFGEGGRPPSRLTPGASGRRGGRWRLGLRRDDFQAG